MFKQIQTKLQTFAGAMMVPIILLVMVGFFVGIGCAFTNYVLQPGGFFYNIFSMLASCGFFFMNSLQMWFAVAISFTLAKKEKGWAAFAGLVLFFTYTAGIGNWANLIGVTQETIQIDALVKSGMSMEAAMNYNALFGDFLGIFTYNMGMFSGLIVGLVASLVHNKFCLLYTSPSPRD